jgi:hypothetical protein
MYNGRFTDSTEFKSTELGRGGGSLKGLKFIYSRKSLSSKIRRHFSEGPAASIFRIHVVAFTLKMDAADSF